MLVQLVPAFVVLVQRREERRRIGRVDHHRPLVLGTDLPDRVELRVVHRHQLAVLVANGQPQALVKLQPLGAGGKALLKPLRFALAPVVVVDAVEVDQREREEAAGVRLVERGERLLQPLAPAAVEIDDACARRRRSFPARYAATRSGVSVCLPPPR